ncbi:MAG: M48 family metalloprotease [Desulfobacterales bacterium]
MYKQFITYIVVLFICATYQPREQTVVSVSESFLLIILLIAFFAVLNRLTFNGVKRRVNELPFAGRDRLFENAVMRQTIAAIALFTAALYLLRIPDALFRAPLFRIIPTLGTVVCLAVFLAFLAVMYGTAHKVYQDIYHHRISSGAYIRSNLAFCIPVVLPWLALSFSSDLLRLLPFRPLNAFLASPPGELTFFILFIFFIAAVGPFFIQKMWRCKPLEPGDRRERIRALCLSAAVGYRDVVYWTLFGGKMITAGVMGLVKRFRYILVTPALMSLLDDSEFDAVMAHEIGHVKQKHMLFYILLFVGYIVLSYVIFHAVYYGYVFAKVSFFPGVSAASKISLLFNSIFIVSFILYFRFIFGFFMRNFERQADTFVYRFFNSAKPLITSLEKIAIVSGIPKDKPNWHHFSLKERIDFLNRCEQDKMQIVRHDKKVKAGIAIYVTGLAFFGMVELGLNFTEIGFAINDAILQKAIVSKLETSPNDPLLYGGLGDLYQSRGENEKAVRAYEKALSLDPESPHVLNNLAWLLATSEDPSIKNPQKALVLAKRAASLDASPYILDTLAESYFAVGKTRQAVETIEAAIKLATENKSHYQNQLHRFKTAVK